jgi:hypothetical protein
MAQCFPWRSVFQRECPRPSFLPIHQNAAHQRRHHAFCPLCGAGKGQAAARQPLVRHVPHSRAAERRGIEGRAGNFPGDRATAWAIRHTPNFPEPAVPFVTGALFDAPFVPGDPNAQLSHRSKEETAISAT